MKENSFYIEETRSISIEEMLSARERRSEIQKKLLTGNTYTLICFTLNIVGPHKVFPLVIKAFEEGLHLITSSCKIHNIEVVSNHEIKENTGFESFILVDEAPEIVKRFMIFIEEDNGLGRLFDIDVLRQDGSKVSRDEVGFSGRKCLLCNKEVFACSRSRTHTVEELLKKEIDIMNQYFEVQYADKIANLMIKSLLYEVSTTPKPGLVDCLNSGSHRDMNRFTFIDSAMALLPFFKEFVLVGLQYSDQPLTILFERIRPIGMRAEAYMLDATNHTNTHKGFIFSGGIFCAALGYAYKNNPVSSLAELCNLCKEMVKLLNEDFLSIKEDNIKTHGEYLYVKYGIKGIRGEAMNGFPALQTIGIPTLKHYLNLGYSLNDAGAITLLFLIASIEDTNIISRSNYEMMLQVQKEIKNLLESTNLTVDNLNTLLATLDETFIERNISPGGCADLLALCYFFVLFEDYPITHI